MPTDSSAHNDYGQSETRSFLLSDVWSTVSLENVFAPIRQHHGKQRDLGLWCLRPITQELNPPAGVEFRRKKNTLKSAHSVFGGGPKNCAMWVNKIRNHAMRVKIPIFQHLKMYHTVFCSRVWQLWHENCLWYGCDRLTLAWYADNALLTAPECALWCHSALSGITETIIVTLHDVAVGLSFQNHLKTICSL